MKKSRHVRNTITTLITIALFAFLASCGGGGGEGAAGESASITLTADVTTIPADNSSSATITATVKDSAGNPVRHYTDVTFSTNLGRFSNGSTTYTIQTQPPLVNGKPDPKADPTGVAVAALIAGTTAGTANVKVNSSGVTQSIKIEITGGTVAEISLKASLGTVRTDNSDSTTITATVLDANNAALKDTTVTFSASDGTLSAPSVVTDANGEANVIFSCGNLDNSNRVSTITAKAGTVSRQILIQVTGTTLDLQTDYTNLEIEPPTTNFGSGNDKATLIITATDAGKNPIYNAHVSASVEPSSTGNVLLSPTGGYTDSNGELQVEVTGTAKGNVTVKVEGLGTTATQSYTVGIVGEIFSISSPQEDPYYLQKGANLTVVVTAPSQNEVIFATTCGAWDGGTSAVVTKAVVNKETSAVLSSADACTATVQVYDADDPNTTDSLKVYIYLSVDAAAQIYLQADAYVVAPSTGGVSNSVNLEALVRDDTYQIVPNVPVSFSIADSTGGGEFVAPPLAYTQAGTGKAMATFTSGSVSSGAQGVTVNAAVVGKPTVSDSVSVVIGGTAGSVVIGQSTSIESINNDTSYKLPMTAQVVDSNGNPVPDARISLQLWPAFYRTGVWIPQKTNPVSDCLPEISNEYPNEDDTFPGTAYYRNLILDPGEDKNADGQLTPASSAAGSVPAEIVADSTGVASFDLIYPKSSAVWIRAELTGSTLVLGSETRSTTEFVLPYDQADATACLLPDSPYNTSEPLKNIELTATPDEVYPDGGTSTSAIRALVTQADLPVPDGTPVSFAIISGIGGLGSVTSSEATATTTAGQASVVYYSGDRPGDVTIRALLADGTSATVNLKLTRGAGEPFTIDLTATPDELSADGGDSQSYIRADVEDSEGYPVFDGTTITFAIITGSGAFESASGDNEVKKATTAGVASTVYYSGDIPGTVGIRAQADNGSFTEKEITLVEVVGLVILAVDPPSITADGFDSSKIKATITDTAGQPVPKGTSVTFYTSLGLFENGLDEMTVPTPNETGIVEVSLIAGTTPGTAYITVSVKIGVNTVTDSATVTFTGTGKILTLTADQTVIAADGVTEATITATLEEAGTALQGKNVSFSTTLGTFVNGSTTTSGTTDPNGQVSVKLKSASTGTATVTSECPDAASKTIQIVFVDP